MALVRCTTHGQPTRGKRDYVASVKPLGYPETAAICGRTDCRRPGMIWLERSEKDAYDAGLRIFYGETSVMQVRAE
jgi:hypothetical protein